MKKNLRAKLIILALLFVAFFGYNAYNRWNDSHFAVDSKAFHVDQTHKALVNNQKKISPQVSLAYQYQLTKTINRTVTIPNLKRKITIHKIWYAEPNLYLLYSVNLRKTDKKPSDVPQLNFTHMIFHGKNHKIVKTNAMNTTMSNTHPGYDSEVYHGELYRGILLQAQTTKDQKKLYGVLNNLGQIDLTGPTLIVPNKGYVAINKFKKLSYPYHSSDDILFQAKMNQDIQLNHGVRLHFNQLKAEVSANDLYFSTNQPAQLPDYLFVKSNISGKNNGSGIFQLPVLQTLDGKTNVIPVYVLPSAQKRLKLTLLKTETFGKGVKLKIPSTVKPGDQIGEAYGCHFYFGGIKKISSVQDYLTIKWDKPSSKNASPSNHIGEFQIVTKSEMKNLEMYQPKTWHHFQLKQDFSLLSISNEKGKAATIFQAMRGPSSDKFNTVNIVLKQSFVKQSKTLTVSLNKLPYTSTVKKQSITLNIPKNRH